MNTAHPRWARRTHTTPSANVSPPDFYPLLNAPQVWSRGCSGTFVPPLHPIGLALVGDAARRCIAISGADSASIYQRQLRRWPTTERLKFLVSVEPERFTRR